MSSMVDNFCKYSTVRIVCSAFVYSLSHKFNYVLMILGLQGGPKIDTIFFVGPTS